MVTYRLIGTNFDVIIRTDASDDQKEFFITEISGLNSIEVEAGFNLEIEQYNEGQLVVFAEVRGLSLYSYDANRNERVVFSPEFFGVFNGVTSKVIFTQDSSLFGTTNGVLQMSIRFRTTRAADTSTNGQILFGFTNYSLGIYKDPGTQLIIWNGPGGGAIGAAEGYTFNDGEWHTIEFAMPANASSPYLSSCIVDGVAVPSYTPITGPGFPDWVTGGLTSGIVELGISSVGGTDDFEGDIDYAIVSMTDSDIVNVQDPSTGVNDGSGNDGVVTDVEQGS